MRKQFKLRCDSSNSKHTRFTMFDPAGANCGSICINTCDVVPFMGQDWNGEIDWCFIVPDPLKSSLSDADREAYMRTDNTPK